MTSNKEGGDHNDRGEVGEERLLGALNKVNLLCNQSLSLAKESGNDAKVPNELATKDKGNSGAPNVVTDSRVEGDEDDVTYNVEGNVELFEGLSDFSWSDQGY